MKLVEVIWVDSETTLSGWNDLSDLTNELVPIRTAGYLVRSDESAVTVCLSLDPKNEHYNGAILIPRVCIKSVNELRNGIIIHD